MDQERELALLAHLRREAVWPGYSGIADYHDGIYDCDYVSPYTKSANNVDADVMVLLQDWASDDALAAPVHAQRVALGHDPTRQTNKRLKSLLKQHLDLDLADTFATNVFPFVKPRDMGSSLPQRDLDRAAREFALPQINIVRPLLAFCLGIAAFNAVAAAAGGKKLPTLADAVASPFVFGTTEIWCQAHTGLRGFNARNKGGVDRVSEDWASMAEALKRRRARSVLTPPAAKPGRDPVDASAYSQYPKVGRQIRSPSDGQPRALLSGGGTARTPKCSIS